MARVPFDMSLSSLDSLSLLIHGGWGVGKTRLAADCLKHESSKGPVRFINVKGEDGQLSASGLDLGPIGETVETVKDFEDMLAEYAKAPLRAVAVDSFKALVRLVIAKECGGKLPEKGDYITIHPIMENLVTSLRRIAQIVFCASPSDKSVDSQITGRTMITPDLPGREAHGVAGWVDAVGYMTAEVVGPGKVNRKVSFIPNGQYLTKGRFRK